MQSWQSLCPTQPPTLTSISTLGGATEDTEFEITQAALETAGNAIDGNGTVDAFIVKAVSSGTLKIGADAASATAWHASTNNLIDGSNNAYWTPAADANGDLNAFTVVAVDNEGAESAPPVQVTVTAAAVNDAPTDFTISDTTVAHSEGNSNVVVGALSTTDADTGDSHTYTLVAGVGDTNNALFNIDGGNLRANDPTAMAAGTYNIRVQSDDGEDQYAEALNITVHDDVAPAVSSIALSGTPGGQCHLGGFHRHLQRKRYRCFNR